MNREKLSRAIMHANVTTDEEVTAKIVAAVVAEFAEELAVVEASAALHAYRANPVGGKLKEVDMAWWRACAALEARRDVT